MSLTRSLTSFIPVFENPFLREFSSVMKKRKTKMNHHKVVPSPPFHA